jgi:predicted nucleotidyltransferase
MKVLGIIAEYNPFHNGHKHHLEQAKALTESTHTVAVMSGHFLQRGEPALMDKWSRARSAVESGVDLVLELPFVYSCQSAETFAYGGVRILRDLNVVDVLAFGSETDDLDILMKVATSLAYESTEFKTLLRKHLKDGRSFPKARELTLHELSDGLVLPRRSNDILGVEYLKWIIRLDASMKPVLIKRHKADYHSTNTSGHIASATAIRNLVLSDPNFHQALAPLIPKATFEQIQKYLLHNRFNRMEHYFDQLLADLLRTTPDALRAYDEIKEGLEHKLLENVLKADSVKDLIHLTLSKRYTSTRIARILCHLLHGFQMVKNYTHSADKDFTPYLRVLAFNQKGRTLLQAIQANSTSPIITNMGRSRKKLDPQQRACLELDILSTNLFFLKANRQRLQEDYFHNPEYLDV